MWIHDLFKPGLHADRQAALRSAAAWMLGLAFYGLILGSCGMGLMIFAYAIPPSMVTENMPPEQAQLFEEGRPYMLVMAMVVATLLFLPALACLVLSHLVRMGRTTPALIVVGLLTFMLAGLTLLQCLGLLLQLQLVALLFTLLLMGPAVAVGMICMRRLYEASQMAQQPAHAKFAPDANARQDEPWDMLEP